MTSFSLTPQIAARLDGASDVERAALIDVFAMAFGTDANIIADAYAAMVADREMVAMRASFEDTVAAYSIPKTTARLAMQAHEMGASLVFVITTDEDTGEMSVALKLASDIKGNSIRTGAGQPTTFDGEPVKARKVINYICHGIKDGKVAASTDEKVAAMHVLNSTGPGKIRETYRKLGIVMTKGKDKGQLPSDESSRNALQAIKALANDAGGAYATLLARFGWE